MPGRLSPEANRIGAGRVHGKPGQYLLELSKDGRLRIELAQSRSRGGGSVRPDNDQRAAGTISFFPDCADQLPGHAQFWGRTTPEKIAGGGGEDSKVRPEGLQPFSYIFV
jgi:hypothetical protein